MMASPLVEKAGPYSHLHFLGGDFHYLEPCGQLQLNLFQPRATRNPQRDLPDPSWDKLLSQGAGSKIYGTLSLFVHRLPNFCIIFWCGLVHTSNELQGILKEAKIGELLTSHSQGEFCTCDTQDYSCLKPPAAIVLKITRCGLIKMY